MVRNSDRWEYGMGLAHTSLPLWLSATLQGAGREGLTTEKKKVVGSGVLKLMVLTRNTKASLSYLLKRSREDPSKIGQ